MTELSQRWNNQDEIRKGIWLRVQLRASSRSEIPELMLSKV
jgi:hypothetical protein